MGEVPHAPRVEPLLLEHVPPVRVGEGDGGSAAVRPSADEHEGPDSLGADQHVAQARPHARNERDRKPGAPHQRVRQGEGVEAALARGLRQHGVPTEGLHQFGVDLHAHRVVPAGDVRDGPRERLPLVTVRSLELALDLPQVPTDPVDAAVDIGRGETPGLADLPDEEEGEQVVVLAQRVDCSRDPGTAFVEIHLRPDVVLATGELDGGNRLVVIDQRRAGDRRAVNGVDVVPWDSDPAPLPTGQVAQAVRVERLGRGLRAAPVGLPPRGSRLQLQCHGDTSSPGDLGPGTSSLRLRGSTRDQLSREQGDRRPEAPGSIREPVFRTPCRHQRSPSRFGSGRRRADILPRLKFTTATGGRTQASTTIGRGEADGEHLSPDSGSGDLEMARTTGPKCAQVLTADESEVADHVVSWVHDKGAYGDAGRTMSSPGSVVAPMLLTSWA